MRYAITCCSPPSLRNRRPPASRCSTRSARTCASNGREAAGLVRGQPKNPTSALLTKYSFFQDFHPASDMGFQGEPMHRLFRCIPLSSMLLSFGILANAEIRVGTDDAMKAATKKTAPEYPPI